MTRRAMLAAGAALAALAAAGGPAFSQNTIKIGEINSHKAMVAFLDPYKKGMELAIEQINAAGGVGGRKLEIIYRDDNANPGDAVRNAEELVSRENVDVLVGGFLSNIGLALADFANQKKRFFLASEPLTDKLVWENGNRYTFRLRPSTYMQVSMLVPEAAKMKKKRWAVVYPNYEYGQSAIATFKAQLKAAQPDVEFVNDQATPLGRIEAGPVVQALAESKPDAIFNALFGADLAKFVREGNTRELFKGRDVVSLLTGEPEYLDPLKEETPTGWYVTGYPWNDIAIPEHKAFLDAYQAKYKDYPRLGAIVGYVSIQAVAAGVAKAGGTDNEKLVTAFRGLEFSTPLGKVQFRAQDHQSTLGAYVGWTAVKDGKGVMERSVFIDGAKVQPSDAEVKLRRPAAANQ